MDRRDWLHLTAISQTYHGNYGQALKTIEAYEAHQKAQGISVEEYEQVHQPLEEDLRARLEASDGKSEEDQHSDEDQRSEEITSSEELSLGNYPNPFNPTTNITFTLPNRSQVSLVVYDLLGREVATLVNEILPAGKQTARFDASNLANGVYLYKLRAGNQEIIRKMTLIK
ncbi:MAG: T9SS type A sorting domain-containing protein [Gracilimonas sp.]